MERYLAAGYGIEVVWSKALKKDALIVKTKQEGMVPRRIIVDLKFFIANSKSVCPERFPGLGGECGVPQGLLSFGLVLAVPHVRCGQPLVASRSGGD